MKSSSSPGAPRAAAAEDSSQIAPRVRPSTAPRSCATRSSSASPPTTTSSCVLSRSNVFAQRDPILDRPVLRFAPASGMKRDDWSDVATKKFVANSRSLPLGKRSRAGSSSVKPELLAGVAPVAGRRVRCRSFRRARDESSHAARRSCCEDFVRIEEITDDQIEAAEVSRRSSGGSSASRRRSWRAAPYSIERIASA